MQVGESLPGGSLSTDGWGVKSYKNKGSEKDS